MFPGRLFTNRYCWRAIAGLLLLLTLFAGTVRASSVPEGFEALLEKQTTLVDVYFGNEFLTSVLGEYNTNEVEFRNPELVAAAIPGLLDRDLVQAKLTGPLDANAHLRCYSRGQSNCGLLEPEVAGIIFDEDRFRVDVFVNAEHLVLQTIPQQAYLPPSNTGWSYLQNFGTAFAGDDDDVFDTYTFNAASMVAYDETRFLLTTNYSDISEWTADDILVRRDFEGREYQLGYYRTVNDASLRFVPETSLRGLRAASTLDTRTDLDSSTGRELTLFLATRARVSLFKDGRLVSSRTYDAGNQVIDTSRLPSGAYPIVIRIEEANGRTREESRFYVKSSRFPPADQTLWGIDIGEQVLLNSQDFIPEEQDIFFSRLNVSTRITDSMAFNGGLAVRDDDGILELGIDQLHPWYDLQLNGAITNDDGYGLSLDARTRWQDVTLSANYRETWDENNFNLEDAEELGLAADIAWFAEDSRQWSTTLSWYVGGGTFNMSARRTELASQEEDTEEYTVSYYYPLVRQGPYQVDLDMEVSEFNDLRQALIGIRFRWDVGNYTHTAATQYQHRELDGGKSEDDLEFDVGTSWHDRGRETGELYWGARASHRSEVDDATVDTRWRGRLGELQAEVRHERADDINRTAAAGSYYSSFAWSQGGLTLGGEDQSRSAIMIDLVGDPNQGAFFQVLVNGSRRGIARIGERNLITLQPYQSYEVELLPKGEGFVSYEQRRETVTLYPGNVARLTWDVSPVNILFGKLLNQDGEAVQNAVIRGASGLAMSDEYGYFQAEVQTSAESLTAETREFTCPFDLPEYDAVNSIALVSLSMY